MADKQVTTGQVFFREAGERDGRKLWSFCGILASPRETPIDGEHQYVITGGIMGGIIAEIATELNGLGEPTDRRKLMVTIHLDDGVDQTNEAYGKPHSAILEQPIWRV